MRLQYGRRWSIGVLVLLAVLGFAATARADVELPSIFGSGMVLQRDRPVPVWGWAEPGEAVEVAIAGQTQTTTAGADGRWRVTLAPLGVRKKPTCLTITGKNRVRLTDVLVGEVWVASGQSNMEWPLSRSDSPRQVRKPRLSRLRLFTVPHVAVDAPQADVAATWVRADDARARGAFSAVAYYFGCEVGAKTGAPVGLVNTTWGGTAILPWTPDPEAAAPVREGGKAVGARVSAALYNGMVSPLVPFALRGVIWYQGESDAARAAEYQAWFPQMIQAWRDAWGQGDFPFYFVQLANFRKRVLEPGPSPWAELREAQFLTLDAVPNTGMAVTIDIGNANDIHPRNKEDVGLRLARWALAHDYGKQVVPSGPLYRSHDVAGGQLVVVHFDHVAKKLKVAGGGRLKGFAIAGEDRRFRWAHAKIVGETVVVSHPKVPEPVAVRYAWADNPECNLVNSEDLPTSPFRTDDWDHTPSK